MKKNNSIVKNAIFKFSLEILRMFIPIISVPYIYRVFNPQIMGQIEFSQSIVGYFFIFAGFGVYTYGLREISRVRDNKEQRDKLFTELFTISTVSSILVTFLYLGYVYFKFNSDNLLKNMLLINSINLISYVFYIEWINEAFENYKFISQKTMIIKLLNLACIFIFIKVSDDYFKYLFLINIFIFINNLASFIYIKKYVNFSLKEIRIKKYLFPLGVLLLGSNINILYTQLDKITLGFYTNDMSEVAYYGIAQKIMSFVMVIVTSILNVSIPRLSYYLGENKIGEYENLLNKIIPYLFLLLFPMGIGIIILSKEICIFFGGNFYIPAQIVIRIFGIRMIITTIASLLLNQVIYLNKKEEVMILILGIGGIFNFILKIILINLKIFIARTAILTTMLSEILIITLGYWYIKKYLKLKINIFEIKYIKYLIFSLFFIPLKFIFQKLKYTLVINISILFIVCIFIYLICLYLSKDEVFNIILKRIKKYISRE